MRHYCAFALFVIWITASLLAQNIQTQASDRTKIMRLQTALNHLTVIEVNEPIVNVAAGSTSFKVEWRENKVFVQPTEADVATNLFIWTASQRLNYELEPAGSVDKMDFAVDEAPASTLPTASAIQAPATPTPAEVLLAGKLVTMHAAKQGKKPVQVVIRDVYQRDGRLMIRYAIQNQGKHDYSVDTPQVFAMDGARYPQSLVSLANSQLGDAEAGHLKSRGQTPVPVVDGRVQSSSIEPGGQAVGVVSLRLPAVSSPTVLRLQFQPDGSGQVSAFLVL